MKLKCFLPYAWKIPVCGIAFYLGTILGSILASGIGLPTPALPEGTDAATLGLYLLLVSLILALTLSFVSRRIHLCRADRCRQGGFLARWLILSFLTWVVYGVNTYLEASIFTTFSAASPFTLVTSFFASFLCSAAVAFLFPPEEEGAGFLDNLKAFFGRRTARDWAWRLPVAGLAFAPIYLFFGRLVVPLTAEYYQQQLFGLTMPTWGQILPVLFVRSFLFLLVCLPVLVAWGTSYRSLVLTLGLALFVLVGFLYMIQAYWFPWQVRLFHSLEILADSLVYAWVLGVLLVKR
jgi:hypothetical protein